MHRPFHAEHIGSLLRPAALRAARAEFEAGARDAAGLRAAEDAAIRHVVRLQEDAGLEVITDGELRRNTYSDSFTIGGLNGVEIRMTEPEGWSKSQTFGHRTARRIPAVTGKLSWKGPQNAENFRFLASVTSRTGKVTLPGPAYIHYRSGREHISRTAYPDLDSFWSDLVEAYHREIASLHEAGCRYVQIDETSLVKLGDDRARGLLKERGDDWRDLLRIYVDVVNRVLNGVPADMRVGLHICRSQDPSWQANVSYAPIAEAVFGGLNVPFFFLEYDTERSGGFEPLAYVPTDRSVVLGLVAPKQPEIETSDWLKGRIAEASRYIDLDRLALSPQCGFATNADVGGAMTEEIEAAKLRLVVDVARDVWGRTGAAG
jgi:5-methyltetrahydropteroyltriglutamate--homocysteine methyltransferase